MEKESFFQNAKEWLYIQKIEALLWLTYFFQRIDKSPIKASFYIIICACIVSYYVILFLLIFTSKISLEFSTIFIISLIISLLFLPTYLDSLDQLNYCEMRRENCTNLQKKLSKNLVWWKVAIILSYIPPNEYNITTSEIESTYEGPPGGGARYLEPEIYTYTEIQHYKEYYYGDQFLKQVISILEKNKIEQQKILKKLEILKHDLYSSIIRVLQS